MIPITLLSRVITVEGDGEDFVVAEEVVVGEDFVGVDEDLDGVVVGGEDGGGAFILIRMG
jgi:hypothetical protein